MNDEIDNEFAERKSLLEILKSVSTYMVDSEEVEYITQRFTQYYFNFTMINKTVILDDGSLYFGPCNMGSISEDYISTLSEMAIRVLINPLSGSNSIHVKMLDDVSRLSPMFERELRRIMNKVNYRAPCLTPVEITPNPYHGKAPKFTLPYINYDSLRVLAPLEINSEYRYPYLSAFVYHKPSGLQNADPKGFSEEGAWLAREKFKRNRLHLDPDLHPWLIGAADYFITVFGLQNIRYKPDFSRSNILEMMNKDSSAGFLPCNIFQLSLDGCVKKSKAQKKDVGPLVADRISVRLDKMEAYFNHQEDTYEPLLPIAVEVKKNENINQEFFTESFYSKLSEMDFEDLKNKLRLFYTSGSEAFVFDRILGEWFSGLFRFMWSAIGIKVEGGGIIQLIDMLSGGESCPLYDEWKSIEKHAYEKYGVDLTERMYGEGDFSGYDFTLVMEMLAVMGGIVTFPLECPDDMSEPVFNQLIIEFIMRMATKLLYMRGINAHMWAQGTMNSGEFMTSCGGSNYNTLGWIMYLLMMIEHNKHDPVATLILTNNLIMILFYSDDNIGSWPVYMNKCLLVSTMETLYHDYINFCVTRLGMKFKWESLRIFNYACGVRVYETQSKGSVVEVSFREGPSFLRYNLSHIYLDGVYLGRYPFRSTEDLIIKMGLSMSATKNPFTHMCHLASLARLSSGNLEAYSQLRTAYLAFSNEFGEPSVDDWNKYYDNSKDLPFSIKMVIASGGRLYTFPNLLDIMEKQTKGFKNRSGFVCLDEYGVPVDGNGYYKFHENPRSYVPTFNSSDTFYDFDSIDDFDYDMG